MCQRRRRWHTVHSALISAVRGNAAGGESPGNGEEKNRPATGPNTMIRGGCTSPIDIVSHPQMAVITLLWPAALQSSAGPLRRSKWPLIKGAGYRGPPVAGGRPRSPCNDGRAGRGGGVQRRDLSIITGRDLSPVLMLLGH